MSPEEIERLREENRKRDPLMANMVDRVREHFPGAVLVKITPAKAGAMNAFERRALKRR